jgi:hypothetical protein
MVRDMKRSMCMNECPISNTAVQVRERQDGRCTDQRYYSDDCGDAGHFIQYHLEFAVRSTTAEFSVVGQFEIGQGRRGQSSRWVRSMSARARSLSACNVSKHCIQKLSPTPMRENDGSSPSPNGAGCAFIIAGRKQKHTPVFPARCQKIVKLFRAEGENNKSSPASLLYRQCWLGLAIRSEDGTIHPFRAEGAKLSANRGSLGWLGRFGLFWFRELPWLPLDSLYKAVGLRDPQSNFWTEPRDRIHEIGVVLQQISLSADYALMVGDSVSECIEVFETRKYLRSSGALWK